jgi:dephospho-CoA kinase
MKALGLTGGVGMGKSTVAQIITEMGVPVLDTDQVARELVERGSPLLEEIAAAFGAEALDSSGALNRSWLAARVFADEDARKTLEAILHPPIRKVWRNQLETWSQQGRAAAVVVIPLLYETEAESSFWKVICVACGRKTQESRLRERNWRDRDIAGRIAAQWPAEEKMSRSDLVIWSEGSLLLLKSQIKKGLGERCGIALC